MRPHGDTATYLTVDLAKPMDVLDETVVATGDDMSQWEIVMSPHSEAPAPGLPDGVAVIEAKEEEGLVDLAFLSKQKLDTEVSVKHDPESVVIDIRGMNPKQVEQAVAEFVSFTPLVTRARLSKAGRNVARVVFDLAEEVSVVAQSAEGGTGGENLWVTIGTRRQVAAYKQAKEAAMAGLPSDLDLRLRKEVLELSGSIPPFALNPVALDKATTGQEESGLAGSSTRQYGLLALFDRAVEADPKYLAAKAEYKANLEASPQAIAAYLPTATYDYQRSSAQQNVKQSSNPVYALGKQSYSSVTHTLTITQPIIKPQAFAKISQAKVSEEQAKVNLLAAEQDLIVRLSSAYLGLAAARDSLTLSKAERETIAKQHELAQARLKNGMGTLVDVSDTAGRLALSEAKEIDAQNKLDDARLAIKEIVGFEAEALPRFRTNFDARPPLPAKVESWVVAALDQNLALQSRAMAVEIAAIEINGQRAGYLPTLNLVGTSTAQDSGGSLYGGGSKVNTNDISFKLNFPLFEGGRTNSLVREAVARKEKSEQERNQEYRHTERLARSSFLNVTAGAKSIEALRKMVIAQESVLQSKVKGFHYGIYTIVAVVDAYRLYYAAKRDYFQVRYDYLANRLKLKQAVGALSRKDLEDINRLFY
ncbi:MAG: TolC family outer membrane protein [Nitrosomonadales bacterium]|nr:TolC family outer membrane protein [Nitrosomonadales bacterium]